MFVDRFMNKFLIVIEQTHRDTGVEYHENSYNKFNIWNLIYAYHWIAGRAWNGLRWRGAAVKCVPKQSEREIFMAETEDINILSSACWVWNGKTPTIGERKGVFRNYSASS